MRLNGLGQSGCLSPAQLYQLALSAGFPPGTTANQGNAGTMAAIAMRESAGCPGATNLSSTEQSYGLWQINVMANPVTALGLSSPSQLLDAATNAQAAYQIWGGNDANLDIAWYILHGGAYTSQYLANLVVVQAAVGDDSANPVDQNSIPDTGDGTDTGTGIDFTDPTTLLIAGAGALALLYALG